MSMAITHGVRVSVTTSYLDEQSTPKDGRFVFSYTVTIANEGQETVQLRSRHWVITNARNHVEEVSGDGVVGKQPVLMPNGVHQYTSGCVLKTAWGTMNGSYRMRRKDGSEFEAEIAPFLLAAPFAVPSTLA
jgi:ApaG protein